MDRIKQKEDSLFICFRLSGCMNILPKQVGEKILAECCNLLFYILSMFIIAFSRNHFDMIIRQKINNIRLFIIYEYIINSTHQ